MNYFHCLQVGSSCSRRCSQQPILWELAPNSTLTLAVHTVMAKIESSRGRPFPRITIAGIEGIASSVRHRQAQLQRLHISLLKAKTSVVDALRQDHGYTEWEAGFEYSLALSELRSHYESIELASEKAAAESIAEETEITHVSAVGIVYIIPQTARNCFYAVISPLCAAVAAGNCVVVEVSLTSRARTTLVHVSLGG